MLQDIRDNSQGTIAKIIIGLLIVVMSLWGVESIIGGFSGEPEVASVDGEPITEREFLRTVQIEGQRRLSQMDEPDPSLLDEDQIRREVLESLIQQQVLIHDAAEQGLELSNEDIDALIRQMPQFAVDGQYSPERFAATVRNMGMGVAEFREAMHKDYVVNQIRAGIIQSGIVTDDNLNQLLSIQNQTRDFRVLSLASEEVRDDIEVSDNDIETYYQNNIDDYRLPERVDAEYIALSLEALAENVDVSDEDLQTYYETRASEMASEERRAAHILLEQGDDTSGTMAAIQERLEAGEAFEDLAAEFSADTMSAEEGGDLGFAERGVYDEAFEEALFALEEGEVSEPVTTSFGVHLIKLLDVRQAEVPPLEEMESELRRELAQQQARDRFAEVRAELADSAYAADDLNAPAEELGLEIRETADVTREGGNAPFDHAGLVRQLFSEDVLRDRFNTELIDVGDNVSVVARVKTYYEAEEQPLDDVREDIRTVLVEQKTREALRERADALIAELEAGQDVEALEVGEWAAYEGQSRNASGLERELMSAVFSLERPEEDGARYGQALTGDGVAIIALDQVNEGEVDDRSTELVQLRGFLSSLEGQREYAAYQRYLRERAEVSRN